MKDLIKMIVVLFTICFISAVILSQVNSMTEKPIAEALRAEKLDAIKRVLPEFDNQPDKDVVNAGGKTWYVAKKDGKVVGVAVEASSNSGYSGEIRTMLGIKANGDVSGLEILAHKETPGLGQKIETPAFRNGVIKTADGSPRNLTNTVWKVKKDGGDIDQIAGATISPRAVVAAVAEALNQYQALKDQILSAPAGQEVTQ